MSSATEQVAGKEKSAPPWNRTKKKTSTVKKLSKASSLPGEAGKKARLKEAKPAKIKKPSLEEPVTPLSSEEQEELARELTQMTRTNILMKSGSAMMSQANVAAQSVLKLFGA